MRPSVLTVVTGTGAEVGKTSVAAQTIRALVAAGCSVSASKPVQSYSHHGATTDADVLAAASGERPEEVCLPGRSYPVDMAPPMAAEHLGLPPVLLADLEREVAARWPLHPVDFGFVEGVGGVASPLAVNGDTAALARHLRPDLILLVARAEMGVINSVRLCHESLPSLPIVTHLNRFDPKAGLHLLTQQWLSERDGFVVTTGVPDLVALLFSRLHEAVGKPA
jgi:dethiobiotin synthetase